MALLGNLGEGEVGIPNHERLEEVLQNGLRVQLHELLTQQLIHRVDVAYASRTPPIIHKHASSKSRGP